MDHFHFRVTSFIISISFYRFRFRLKWYLPSDALICLICMFGLFVFFSFFCFVFFFELYKEKMVKDLIHVISSSAACRRRRRLSRRDYTMCYTFYLSINFYFLFFFSLLLFAWPIKINLSVGYHIFFSFFFGFYFFIFILNDFFIFLIYIIAHSIHIPHTFWSSYPSHPFPKNMIP